MRHLIDGTGKQATKQRTRHGRVTASRNAYKGGHWLMLRELKSLANGEVKAARELIGRLSDA